MKELEKLQRAIGAAMACLRDLSANVTAKETLDYINSVLNPEPEYEEVEIERFVVFYPDGSTSHLLTREELQGFDCKGGTVARVSHTIERVKPCPVEKSVSVEGSITEMGNLLCAGAFKKHTHVHGKSGTLTFTYIENAKYDRHP